MDTRVLSARLTLIVAAAAAGAFTAGCAATRPTRGEERVLVAEQDVAFEELDARFPGIRGRAESAYAYAIFPRVTKGAAGIGGARGEGLVYRGGEQIGTAVLTQASLGAQIGGSTFRQLIVFQDRRALDRLIDGRLEFSARAQAAAGAGGEAGDIAYDDGVAVYTVSVGGLILDASIGGQSFDYFPGRR